MTDPLHIVCPHCHTTNRVRQADLAQALGARFNIRSIPTLALFANGREVARQPGAMGVADIVRWTRAHL